MLPFLRSNVLDPFDDFGGQLPICVTEDRVGARVAYNSAVKCGVFRADPPRDERLEGWKRAIGQVLQQASTAMAAQANQLPQQVLQLLQRK